MEVYEKKEVIYYLMGKYIKGKALTCFWRFFWKWR
jgi:hypothetical protein